MELYVGGLAQGKTAYVQRKYEGRKLLLLAAEAYADCAFSKEPKLAPESILTDQGEYPEVIVLQDLHLAVKRLMWKQMSEAEELGAWLGDLEEEIARLEAAGCKVVIIADEVGCGVVPMEPKERMYRECVGRCLIELAGKAESVERVICGLGQKIK